MSQTQFATAQEALHALEEAFRQEDLDQAVACKDFHAEARIMLRQINPELASDEQVLQEAAETLEAAFRAAMQEEGFPDLKGVVTEIVQLESLPEEQGIYVATELQQFPDGTIGLQQILMYEGDQGWKVLVPVVFEDEGEEDEDDALLGPDGGPLSDLEEEL